MQTNIVLKILKCTSSSSYSLSLSVFLMIYWFWAELTNELCSDVAQVLSHCQDVYSAEVPVAIQDLARCVVSSGLQDQVLTGTDQVHAFILQTVKV